MERAKKVGEEEQHWAKEEHHVVPRVRVAGERARLSPTPYSAALNT